ncbi:MAG: hypothetical protein CSA38_03735 [Flavobacteriales bacterium]|nr:MAG: hypothetical protein CSA38_03735 [Flavobacteriales bacterium]
MGQKKNKFSKDLKTRKLGYKHRGINNFTRDDYFQQFYWVSEMEKLRAYPHLKKMNINALYAFIVKIYPPNPTKKLNEEEKQLREKASLALDEFFKRKEYKHEIVKLNLLSYVDPSGEQYVEHISPDKVEELIKKKIYTVTTYNTATQEQKTYYLKLDRGRKKTETEFINLIPDEKKNKKFYKELYEILPNFKFPDFVPTLKKGNKRDKRDRDYIYITPFEVGDSNIMYRTKDFKKYELAKIKKNGAPWIDNPERRKRHQSKK